MRQKNTTGVTRKMVRRALRKIGMNRPGTYIHHSLRGTDRRQVLCSLLAATYMVQHCPHILASNRKLAS